MLLDWCKEIANPYKGVSITNWTDSFWDGLAYCAIIDHYHPGVIDFNSLDPKNKQYNLDLAFNTAEVGIIFISSLKFLINYLY